MKTTCTVCNVEIEGAMVFGSLQEPMCWRHHSELVGEGGDVWYGLAPHTHKLDGGVMKTTFIPLPKKTGAGIYDLGWAIFTPDPDTPDCGVYEASIVPGWR